MNKRIAILVLCLSPSAFAGQQELAVDATSSYPSNLTKPNVTVQIDGLSHCSDEASDELQLDSREAVTVIVHGCFSSAGRFRSLADVFEFHGQQTVCFSYDDRDRLTSSAAKLKSAIEALSTVLEKPRITLIGHSQGGLLARRALIEEPSAPLQLSNAEIDLATISSPFGGIEAASHCGSKTAAWLSLGIVKLVCQMVTGLKYKDIPATSEFIQQPGKLDSSVSRHLKIVTDETNSCRVYDEQGKCVEDDFVFSVTEQSQPAVDQQLGVIPQSVKAGHVEIVGIDNVIPLKLIDILQQQGYLRKTPPESAPALTALLANLYLSP